MSSPRRIVLVCGETSGDLHAARLVSRLLDRFPGASISGMGGARCREAGMDTHFDYREFHILGFTGVLANLPRLWRLERGLKSLLRGADLFVAVDYPGLNLRLAAFAHSSGVPVLYFISPQVWAWGEGRVARMKRFIDRMAVILPFEKEWFAQRGMDVTYVGHPFVTDHPLPDVVPVGSRRGVALLPGSREEEVRRILPVMLRAAEQLGADGSESGFVLGRSPSVHPSVYDELCRGATIPVELQDDAVEVMRTARLSLVASGTATLQCALMETPLVIVYRVGGLNYWLARRMIRIHSIGLVNVVLGERVAPEFVQGDAQPADIADAARALLTNVPAYEAMQARFRTLRGKLGGGGGTRDVADIANEMLA